MSEFDPVKYKAMVKEHQETDRPLAWFDSIYTDAKGDYKAVFWADLAPSPYLWQDRYKSKYISTILLKPSCQIKLHSIHTHWHIK